MTNMGKGQEANGPHRSFEQQFLYHFRSKSLNRNLISNLKILKYFSKVLAGNRNLVLRLLRYEDA